MINGRMLTLQLLRSAVGFIAGLVSGGGFLAWSFFSGATADGDPVVVVTIVGTALVSASVIGASLFLPAVLLVTVAEIASLRSLVYHVGAGGLLAFGLWMLGPDGARSQTDALTSAGSIVLAAGFIGGAAYWLLAGRSSGCWKTLPQDNSATD